MITRLAFYDFDGTLMNTPMPDEGRLVWKQKTGQEYPHAGWWGRPESISLEVFDIQAVPSVKSALQKDVARPDTYVAILTSRLPKLTSHLEAILKKNGIHVDGISTKEKNKTKDIRIKEFLQKFPNVKEVDVYDDRQKEFEVLLPLKKELTDVVKLNVYAVDNGSIKLLESVSSIKTLINEEINRYLVEGKGSNKEQLMRSKNIPKEMKEKILQYGIGEYKEGGFVKGISMPEGLKSKSSKSDGVSLGADKNGFYVYTHRARSKSYATPEKIPVKDIEFIESTG